MKIRQLINVITPNRFRLKHARVFAFGNLALIHTFHYEDTGSIVWDKGIERVHHEIENFLQVEGAADFLGDVEQHSQLVCGCQTRQSQLFYLFTHKMDTLPSSPSERWPKTK